MFTCNGCKDEMWELGSHTYPGGCLDGYRDKWETIETSIRKVLGTKNEAESLECCNDWSHFLGQVVQLRRKMYAWKCQHLCQGCITHSVNYSSHYDGSNEFSCLYGNYPYIVLTCQSVSENQKLVLAELNQQEMSWKLAFLNSKMTLWQKWYCAGCITEEAAQQYHDCLKPLELLIPTQITNKDRNHAILFARLMEKEPNFGTKNDKESCKEALLLKIPRPKLKRYDSVIPVEAENAKKQCVDEDQTEL